MSHLVRWLWLLLLLTSCNPKQDPRHWRPEHQALLLPALCIVWNPCSFGPPLVVHTNGE